METTTHELTMADARPVDAPSPAWCAEHLTFEDLMDYLGALSAKLNRSWLHPLDQPIDALARFAGTLAGAAQMAVDPHRSTHRTGEATFWHHAAGDGRAELACALMDFCEIAGARAKGDR